MKTIALVGRPNVGKSRLFNRIVGRRTTIVEGTPGVTRDRVDRIIEKDGRLRRWIDTGGIGSADPLAAAVRLQAEIAIEAADVVILVTDVRAGIEPLDREIADRLRRAKIVVVAANKADDAVSESGAGEFAALGFSDVFPVSAEHGRGVSDMLEEIDRLLGDEEPEETPVTETRIAIVGRPNVGKSSLLNRILGEERAIVSPIPGTTRDAVEDIIDLPEGRIALVDTAGIRKRRQSFSAIESYMVTRTRDAVSAADVAIVVVDALDGITEQDRKILDAVFQLGRGAVIALNKWDAIAEKKFDSIVADMRYMLGNESHVPIVSVSALTGQRMRPLLEAAIRVAKNLMTRIPTGQLNRIFAGASISSPRGMRIKYALQKSAMPPTFLVFGPAKPSSGFAGNLKNLIRGTGGFDGVPIVLEFRKR